MPGSLITGTHNGLSAHQRAVEPSSFSRREAIVKDTEACEYLTRRRMDMSRIIFCRRDGGWLPILPEYSVCCSAQCPLMQ
jgi:hypothetical protein